MKVYFTIGRKAVFQYTYDRLSAQEKNYETNLGEIHSTLIKIPKRTVQSKNEDNLAETSRASQSMTTKSSQKRSRSASRVREAEPSSPMVRPTRRLSLSRRRDTIFQFKVFDQDKASEGGYDSSSDDEEKEPYYIKLLSADNKEVAQLKCSTLQPLKNLSDAVVSAIFLSFPPHL